jgi:uncharacterized protein
MAHALRLAVCIALLACLFLPLPAAEVPFLSGRVNDLAEILSPATVRDLERLLKTHEDSTSNQVAILTVASLEGEAIEAYALRVAESWRLGQKGKDNGVLLLIARDDRKVRIEVGRGLEGSLPDITCGQIIRHQIVPRFKKGDYDGGTRAGIEAILSTIAGSYVGGGGERATPNIFFTLFGSAIFLVVVGMFTMLVLFQKGFVSWFLYVFLLPFWFAFPFGLYGAEVGIVLLALYAILVPLAKLWFRFSPAGASVRKRWGGGFLSAGSARGGVSGSSGGGFSGGGGGFSGGGASGSW